MQLNDIHAGVEVAGRALAERVRARPLAGAINMPLARALASTGQDSGPDPGILVYCDTGRRSASAVFLLTERGFDAQLVRGGIGVTQLTEAA